MRLAATENNNTEVARLEHNILENSNTTESTNKAAKTATHEDTKNFSTFSREELEAKVIELRKQLSELQQKVNDLTNPPPSDWHSWFYSLLHIVLHKFPTVDIEREVVLGAQPPRADFVVVNDDNALDLGLQIFRTFRKKNILEFKSPDDTLSKSVLWKVIGYAGFYIAKYDISAEDVTLTIFRGAKPEKMFSEMADFVEADETKGIYHIKDWKVDFPIQIVITTELEGKEYAGFRAISKSQNWKTSSR